VDAAEGAFRDAQGGVVAFVKSLGVREANDSIFLLEDPADDVDAEPPHPGGLLHQVMLFEGRPAGSS
jgi:hypothetical protein